MKYKGKVFWQSYKGGGVGRIGQLVNFGYRTLISDPLQTDDDSQITILQFQKVTQKKSKARTHA